MSVSQDLQALIDAECAKDHTRGVILRVTSGDGQVDFGAIFSKLTAIGFDGWAVVEWECAIKHPEDGAREGAAFVRDHIIRPTEFAFDDFADGGTDEAGNRKMLGID